MPTAVLDGSCRSLSLRLGSKLDFLRLTEGPALFSWARARLFRDGLADPDVEVAIVLEDEVEGGWLAAVEGSRGYNGGVDRGEEVEEDLSVLVDG
jgi:hypothetical protein